MRKIKNCAGNTAFIYAETFEDEAFEQVKKMINFDAYVDSKVRIMPDAHAGKGCTVGTTMTIADKVTPNLVGVDIGCGMLTIQLRDTDIDLERLDGIIRSKIPHGFGIHSKALSDIDFSNLRCRDSVDIERAKLSAGSLGGGNHFIEVGRSERLGNLYLIIHSGSRKLGGDTCKYYQGKALKNSVSPSEDIDLMIAKLKSEGKHNQIESEVRRLHKNPIDKDLAYLSGDDFDDYMNDMSIVQSYASFNRKMMAKIIMDEMGFTEEGRFETIHNYIDFGRMILRKGAVSAELNEMLLIPINMRDGSLLCIGKGNSDWNYSAPHGAGRLMSRTKAKQELSMSDFEGSMEGIYTTSVCKETLDEAPQAYKSMDEIRKAIVDTVECVDTIKPIYNFKSN